MTDTTASTELTALVLNCSLKPAPTKSSSEKLGEQVLSALSDHGVKGEQVRVIDQQVRFGVQVDEGDGDGWPAIRRKMLDSDILVIATPIWLGQPSAVCKMVLERLDAELSETDDEGRMSTYGKVAALAVVGNEDGAHHVSAEVFQALNDTGFTIPANGVTYWSARRCRARTTRTSRTPPRRPPRRPRRSRPTPYTWRGC